MSTRQGKEEKLSLSLCPGSFHVDRGATMLVLMPALATTLLV